MFRPQDGYEEPHIREAIIEHLQPRPTVKAIVSPSSFGQMIAVGDVITVEPASHIVEGGMYLLRSKGSDINIATIFRKQGIWYAKADNRIGYLDDSVEVLGRLSAVVKNQL